MRRCLPRTRKPSVFDSSLFLADAKQSAAAMVVLGHPSTPSEGFAYPRTTSPCFREMIAELVIAQFHPRIHSDSCIGRIEAVVEADDRLLTFVSHNLTGRDRESPSLPAGMLGLGFA